MGPLIIPANHTEFRETGINERLEWGGNDYTNEKEVIRKPLPLLSNTVDARGDFEGKKFSLRLRRWKISLRLLLELNFFIGAERATTFMF